MAIHDYLAHVLVRCLEPLSWLKIQRRLCRNLEKNLSLVFGYVIFSSILGSS